MKKRVIVTLMALLLFSSSLFADNAKLKSRIEQIPMIRNIGARVTDVIVYDKLYQFKAEIKGKKAGLIEAFVTKDFNVLMVGQAFNANSGQKLTMPLHIDTKKLKSLAAYKMGNGKDEYFVFTDPQCPYCQKLERKLTAVKDNVTLYTILFPLSFHKNAKSMSRYILNQKDDKTKAEAMKSIANKDTKYQKETYSKMQLDILNGMIQRGLDEATKIGINGTPTILNSKGVKVSSDAIIKK